MQLLYYLDWSGFNIDINNLKWVINIQSKIGKQSSFNIPTSV